MSGAFQLQSLEDEEASTWECVDIDGQITGWNTDPNKCLRGSYPLCGSCTNRNCFALGFDTGHLRHVIPSSKIPSEAIGKQVTLTFEAAMWKYSDSDPSSLYPIKIDVGSVSFTYDMSANTTNSTCEGKRTSISRTFTLPPPGPDGLAFTLWKVHDPDHPTCLDVDNITLGYEPTASGWSAAADVPVVTDDPVPTPRDQMTTTDTGSKRNTTLAIALGVVALILALIASGLLFWFCCRRKKTKPSEALLEEKEKGLQETLTAPVIIMPEVSSTANLLRSGSTPVAPEESRSNPAPAVSEIKSPVLPVESLPTAQELNKISDPVPPTQEFIAPPAEAGPTSLSAEPGQKLIPSPQEPILSSDKPTPSSPVPILPLGEPIQPPLVLLPDELGPPSGELIPWSQQAVTASPSNDDTPVLNGVGLDSIITGAQQNAARGPDVAAETQSRAGAVPVVGSSRPRLGFQTSRYTQETRTGTSSFRSSTSRTARTTTFTSSSSIRVRSSRNQTVVQMSTSEELTHSG